MSDCKLKADQEKVTWFFRPFWIWILIFSIGPLALPLLFLSPRFSYRAKIIISLLVILVTGYSAYSCYQLIILLKDSENINSLLKEILSPEQLELISCIIEW